VPGDLSAANATPMRCSPISLRPRQYRRAERNQRADPPGADAQQRASYIDVIFVVIASHGATGIVTREQDRFESKRSSYSYILPCA